MNKYLEDHLLSFPGSSTHLQVKEEKEQLVQDMLPTTVVKQNHTEVIFYPTFLDMLIPSSFILTVTALLRFHSPLYSPHPIRVNFRFLRIPPRQFLCPILMFPSINILRSFITVATSTVPSQVN